MHVYQPQIGPRRLIALFASRIQAGFPSPAEDYVEGKLDLNELLIRRPSATYFLRVTGTSMTGAGIYPGDILVVDRSAKAAHGSIVVAAVDGELTVKRLEKPRNGRPRLVADNPDFPAIDLAEDCDVWLWGVVTSSVRRFG